MTMYRHKSAQERVQFLLVAAATLYYIPCGPQFTYERALLGATTAFARRGQSPPRPVAVALRLVTRVPHATCVYRS